MRLDDVAVFFIFADDVKLAMPVKCTKNFGLLRLILTTFWLGAGRTAS